MTKFEITILAALAVLYLALPLIIKRGSKKSVFSARKIPSWFSSLSLLIIYWNPTLEMINTRLVIEKGYSGLWFLKDILLTIGIAPVLFAPMWARLNFVTDNQLILKRFSGIGAKILSQFRALYVGLFISAFIGSFYILGIQKILLSVFHVSESRFFLFAFFISILLVLKNDLATKIRMDSVIAVFYILFIPLAIYFLVTGLGGWGEMKQILTTQHSAKILFWPTGKEEQESMSNVMVFLFVQWLSARILDHSNANTQRYFSIGNPWEAFKAILFPVIVISIMFGLSSFVWDAAIISGAVDGESAYVNLMVQFLPPTLKVILLITFIAGFLTTWEALISWGGSYIAVDFLQEGLGKKFNDRQVKYISYGTMLLIGWLSLVFALMADQLADLKYLLFSISAGVGPVILLRWFWWRINAWSQFSAMIASAVYAISYDWVVCNITWVNHMILQLQTQHQLGNYPIKLLILTPLVILTWLIVTLVTPPDDKDHLREFVRLTKTGGLWPFPIEQFYWKKKLMVIAGFSCIGLLPVWVVWLMKFGSVYLAGGLMIAWAVVLWYVYHQMKKLLF
jgi:Na+/proline symporter